MNLKKQRMLASVRSAAPRGRVLSFTIADREILKDSDAKVFASINKSDLQDFDCQDCGTRVTASAAASAAPFCACCGSDRVTASGAVYKTEVAASDDELVGVECSSCHEVSAMHASVVNASAGESYCPQCGTPMHVTAEAVPAAPIDMVDEAAGDTPPKIKEAETATSDEEDEPADEDEMVDAPSKESAASLDAAWPFGGTRLAASAAPAGDKTKSRQVADFLEEDMPLDMVDDFDGVVTDSLGSQVAPDAGLEIDPEFGADAVDPLAVVDADDTVSFDENFGGSTPDLVPTEDGTTLLEMQGQVGDEFRIAPENDLMIAAVEDLPLEAEGDEVLDAAGLDDTVTACAFVQTSPTRLVAMKGHHSVAVLTREKAGANAEIMFTDAFARAVTETARTEGLRRGLASVGFVPVRVKAAATAAVQRRVSAAVSKVREEQTAREKATADSFAVAAVGLARSFWRNQENPLFDAITRELSSLGVQRPEKVARRVLAEAGPGYSHALCTVAQKLAGMSAETRREYAEALDMVAEAPADVDEVLEDDLVADDLAGDEFVDPSMQTASVRLSQPGATGTKVCALLGGRQTASVSTGNANIDDMLAGRTSIFNF